MQLITQAHVQKKIINIRNQKVILDSDVAGLYHVETKRINEAVSRNPDKFPPGYLIELTPSEWEAVKSQIATSPNPLGGGKVRAPKAFTEKGLYMLATILKSPRAVETTLTIIDTFAKVRNISETIKTISHTPDNSPRYQQLIQKTGDLISDLVVPDNMETSESEASIEVNLAMVKFKYAVKKKNNKELVKI
jgi:hypothetical protein